ncbi:MAG: ABC transporter permease [Candidatus Sericytochromatia bacterium]|nr:ABC transporter permease [Candidatus Sericytochromatia bacterium]
MKAHRIGAMITRHLYTFRHSPLRLVEMVYWPLLDLLVWGFLTVYLQRSGAGVPNFVAFFVGALILWDLLFRAQQGVAISYLEEVWSRNLMNLFVSPLTIWEYITSLVLVSLMKLTFSVGMMVLLALLIYGFNLFSLGMVLIPFIANLLLMGWSVGILTTALILRYGQAAESLAWVLAFLFQPISAVFYPVSVLPPVLRAVARCVPASYVFEGMRAVIAGKGYPRQDLAWAFGLNAVYATVALGVFAWTFHVVRDKGLLGKVGE